MFPIVQGTLPWQPILGLKMGEIDRLTFIRRLGIPERVEYRNSDFKRFIGDDLATLFINLVNFGPVTPEFKIVKGVHPLVYQQFGYAAPLLHLAGISTKFCGAISSVLSFVSFFSRGALLLCRAGYTLGSATHF